MTNPRIGNPKVDEDEPAEAGGENGEEEGPPAPDWLTPEAKNEWRRTGKRLRDAGAEVDANTLVLYCEAWSTWRHAQQKIAEYGPVIKTKAQYLVQSPYFQIASKAMDQMMKLGSEFGVTPRGGLRDQPAFNLNVTVILKQQLLALGLPPKVVESLIALVGTAQ
jgi:P27 family predicted phage terminase small subunit